MTPLVKIHWLNETQPELTKQVAYYVSIKEYIFFRLFGQLVCDYSTASGTGYFDIHQFKWAEEALNYLSITQEQLPEVMPSTTILNGLSKEKQEILGLENDISFI